MKTIIIGNGILGLSIAFRLLQNTNSKIVIIGKQSRLGGASPAAGAMLNSFAELEHGSLDSIESQEYFGMSYLATQMWPKFERELIDFAGELLPSECAQCQVLTGGCFSKGTYVINNATSDSLEDKNYQAILNGLKEFNEPYYEIDPCQIPNYFPDPKSRALKALLIPNEGWLNPKIVLKKLENLLLSNDRIEYIDDSVVKIVERDGNIKTVLTESNQMIEGENFVLANGVGINKLLEQTALSDIIQPIFSAVGVSLEILSPNNLHSNVIRTPNRGGGCGIYTVPYFQGPNKENNHILVGASSVTTLEPQYHGSIVSIAHLLDSAIKEINQNFYDAKLITTNVGNRPVSLDQYPLIGYIPNTNIFIATGTKRDGFHLAPLISEFICKLIKNPNGPNEYLRFSPGRKPIKNLSRIKAIEDLAISKMNEAFQHGYRASSIYQFNQLYSDWIRQISITHDEIGATDWGIPKQMLGAYREILSNPKKYNRYLKFITEK